MHTSQSPVLHGGQVHFKAALKILHSEVALTPCGAQVQMPPQGERQHVIGLDKQFIIMLSSMQS